MENYIVSSALVLAAYLLGSISSAIITCRLMGLPDPRTLGSNNPGATNVLRFGGKKAAAITLVGDMLKGLVPVLLAQWLAGDPLTLALVGVAAFLGHLYPVFFRFAGGKGVATSLGVYFGIHWLLGVAVAGVWLIMAKGFKVSSLSALVASFLAPIFAWVITGHLAIVVACVFITILLYWRHRSNIRNLINKTEDSIGTDAE